MELNTKRIVIFFLVYKITILVNIILNNLMQNVGIINSLLATVSIVVGTIMYWYFVINVFGNNKIEEILISEKIVFFSNLLIKIIEYYVIFFVFPFQDESNQLLFCIGLIALDTLLEYKMYRILLRINNGITSRKDFDVEEEYYNLSREKKHLLWLYVLSVVYIIITIIQLFFVIIETDVTLAFILKFLIMSYYINDYVNMSVKEKKVYLDGKCYLIGVLFLILETGAYWILSGYGVYIKAIISTFLILSFDVIIAGQIGKRYNNIK